MSASLFSIHPSPLYFCWQALNNPFCLLRGWQLSITNEKRAESNYGHLTSLLLPSSNMRTDMKLRQQKPKEKVNISQGRSSIVLHVVQLQHRHAVSYLLTVQKSLRFILDDRKVQVECCEFIWGHAERKCRAVQTQVLTDTSPYFHQRAASTKSVRQRHFLRWRTPWSIIILCTTLLLQRKVTTIHTNTVIQKLSPS